MDRILPFASPPPPARLFFLPDAAHAWREEVDGTTARLVVQHLSNAYFRKSLEDGREALGGVGAVAPILIKDLVIDGNAGPRGKVCSSAIITNRCLSTERCEKDYDRSARTATPQPEL